MLQNIIMSCLGFSISFGLMRHSTATKAENKMSIRLEATSCRCVQVTPGGQSDELQEVPQTQTGEQQPCTTQLASITEEATCIRRTHTHTHTYPTKLEGHLQEVFEVFHKHEKMFQAMILLIPGE